MLPKSTKKAINMAIPKATRSSSLKAPKEKHVKNLVGATLTRDPAVIEEILRGLCKRLEKDNWVVVLKTLMIFHRIFRDGDVAFVESLRTRSAAVFGLKRFSVTAPAGSIYTLFVQKYAKYLEENVSVLRLIGFNFERQKDCMKNLDSKEAFKRVPKLQSQLNALLNCKMRQHHIGRNGLIISTYMLLLKDSLVLYPMLNVGVIGMIDQVFKMRKKEAQRVLEVYTLFVKETAALIHLYEISRSFTDRLPPIHPAKTTLVDVLTAHISKLPDDGPEDLEGATDDEERMAMEDHLMTTNSATAPATGSKGSTDDESDTSSESSDEEDGGFGFGFAAPSNGTAAAPGAPAATAGQPNGGPFDFGGFGAQDGVSSRASVGPNSFAFLSQQPTQPITTSSQGWDIFDRSFTASTSSASLATQPAADPFAAFSSLSIAPSSPSPTVVPQTYQDRAAAAKSGISQVYSQQPLQPSTSSSALDNPFAPATASLSSPNPFGSPVPSTNGHHAFATTTPPPASSTGSYNPFL
jgi:hypothetical protein